jgi:inner membrane protein
MGLSANMRDSVMFKMLFIAIIIIVLLIPLFLIRAVISERQKRRDDAVYEVSEKWGGIQTVTGPIISVPYTVYYRDDKDNILQRTEYAQFLPDLLDIEAELLPEIRSRGIFDIVVYTLSMHVHGSFGIISLEDMKIPEKDILWHNVALIMSLTDMRGLNEAARIALNGTGRIFEPGVLQTSLFMSGIHVALPDFKDLSREPIAFDMTIRLRGNERAYFVPVGRDTEAWISSPWADPSFIGAYLPQEREITGKGFQAQYRVSHLSRNYPQFFKTENADLSMLSDALYQSAFGVELFLSVDHYHKTMRSVKYAVLFILLTFAAFFLFEMMGNQRIHPFQYVLIGFAMNLFYLLLLSLSEHLPFTPSYVIASTATIGLIVGYASAILVMKRQTVLITGLLTLLYACLYVLLRLEDYALLFGTLILLVVLALIMFLTRKVDWYAVRLNPPRKGSSEKNG